MSKTIEFQKGRTVMSFTTTKAGKVNVERFIKGQVPSVCDPDYFRVTVAPAKAGEMTINAMKEGFERI